jgi:hypothetical protein
MVFALFPSTISRADGEKQNIGKDTQYEGESVWEAYDENNRLLVLSSVSVGDITIPATEEIDNTEVFYHLVMDQGEVSADSVLIQSGATLHILGEGRLTCSNISAQDGAHMELDNVGNLPAGLTVYDYFVNDQTGERDVLTDISGDPNWGQFIFTYHATEGLWLVSDQFGEGGGEEPQIPEYEVKDSVVPEDYGEEIWDDFTAHIYCANGSYGQVNVPTDYFFDVLGDSEITGSLIMGSDGVIHVEDRVLTIAQGATVSAQQGARIECNGNGSVLGLTLYTDDGQELFEGELGGTEIVYDNGKWCVRMRGPEREEKDAIVAEDYHDEQDGDNIFRVYFAHGNYGSVTVPQDYILVVDDDTDINNALVMEANGRIFVDNRRLRINTNATFQISEGAQIEIQGNGSVEGLQFYTQDGQQEYMGSFEGAVFEYQNGKWVVIQEGNGGNGGEPQPPGGQYGFERLQEELNGTWFAFGDVDNNGNVDEEDLRYGFVRTLYDDFRVQEGRYQSAGEAIGLKRDFEKQDPTNMNINIQELLNHVTLCQIIEGDTITATDKNNVVHTFEAYEIQFTIERFYTHRADLDVIASEQDAQIEELGEEPVVLTAKIYKIDMENSREQVIIKVKDQFFVRDAYDDRDDQNNNDDLEIFEGLNARALMIVADYDNANEDITIFGNYVRSGEVMSDETSDSYFAAGFGSDYIGIFLGDKYIVFRPGFMGVTLSGIGEEKSPLGWSVESSLSIAETGDDSEEGNTETDIYFGFNKLKIEPITGVDVEGLSAGGIEDVRVLDGIGENAVKVSKESNGDYIVEFLSDYYDTIRIEVVYQTEEGTVAKVMQLNRVGILMQKGLTAGDTHTINVFHGHNSGHEIGAAEYEEYKAENSDKTHGQYSCACYATYYYPTSSNSNTPDVSLFVTYTYEDGTVERKLLETKWFTPATDRNVAMSDYILYMGDGRNAPVKVEAIAVPNANEDGTINGAKLGAGKGVEQTFSGFESFEN